MLIHIRIRSSQQSVNTGTLEDVTKAKTTVNPLSTPTWWSRALYAVIYEVDKTKNRSEPLRGMTRVQRLYQNRKVCLVVIKVLCSQFYSYQILVHWEGGRGEVFYLEKTVVSVLHTETY